MPNDRTTDPTVRELVTRVVSMAPDAPPYPDGTPKLVGSADRRSMPAWLWAPIAAAAVFVLLIPLALRSTPDSAPIVGSTVPPAEVATSAPVLNPGGDLPEASRDRLSLLSRAVGRGGAIVIDFPDADPEDARTGGAYWFERLNSDANEWEEAWVLWSVTCRDCSPYANATGAMVVVPELVDTILPEVLFLPPTAEPGTYRVCVAGAADDGPCATVEVTDDTLDDPDIALDLDREVPDLLLRGTVSPDTVFVVRVETRPSGPIVHSWFGATGNEVRWPFDFGQITLPNEVIAVTGSGGWDRKSVATSIPDVPDDGTPEFGFLTPGVGEFSGLLLVVPAQWLTGGEATLAAREDGFIGEGEDLPNGFYIRPLEESGEVWLEPSSNFEAMVYPADDPSELLNVGYDEWLTVVLNDPTGPGAYVHLTYDRDGRVATVDQQFVP